MLKEMLNQTEDMTKAMRSIRCGNNTSFVADTIVSQLANHTAITLRRSHNETERSVEDTVKLLPSFGSLVLEMTLCQHANASRLLADALRLFRDNESDAHQVRRYYSQQYNEVAHVLNAYIEQLREGGSALSTAVS